MVKVKTSKGETRYRAEVTINGRKFQGPRVALKKDARPALWAKIKEIAAQPTPEELRRSTPVSSLPNVAKAPNSREVFRCALEAYAPHIGHLFPSQVTVEVLEAATDALDVAPVTKARYQREIVAALRREGVELKPKSPMKPEDKVPDIRVLSPVEQRALVAAALTPRIKLAIELLLDTGLRPGEACGLKHSDRFEDGIWVKRSRTMEQGRPNDKDPKTARSAAWVPLTEKMQTVVGPPLTGYVVGLRGRPWNTGNLRRAVIATAARANLGHVTPNELRHTAAVNMLASGNDPATVASITRHSVEVLLKIYYRGSNDLKREAMKRTEARLHPKTASN